MFFRLISSNNKDETTSSNFKGYVLLLMATTRLSHESGKEHNKLIHLSVDFNLVQYFTANIFSIKEQKRYNGKYTHYTDIFPLETQTGKTNIFYIHS
jgi:hypothetical protein